ncbi:MAG TPA: MraY family glycosyltransferase [Longimicrobiaceae bacterium]|nr:MraY family glycosyltransferase [Longimicrobiaceae bacterium]
MFSSAFAMAVLLSLLATPLVVRFAISHDAYDLPSGGRRVHIHPIPRIGGVAVFAAAVLAVGGGALVADGAPLLNSRLITGILLGGGLLFAAGLVDDLRGLRPLTKLAFQCAAALIAYRYGLGVSEVSLWGGHAVDLGFLALPVTLLWIVGVTNAFNLIDGLDGLATGVALVTLGTTCIVAWSFGHLSVVLVSLALVGALVGFLRYNFNPASIFLGDSGSLFIGFALAVLSVAGAQTPGGVVLAVVPVFALALPLLDTTLAILRRLLRGVPLSQADGRHIHHRLLALGLSHRAAALVMYLFAALLATLGVALAFARPAQVVAIVVAGGFALLLLTLFGIKLLNYHEFLEAGRVVLGSYGRLRRAVRDQIHARDVAQLIRSARSLEEVNQILASSVQVFCFHHMEVCTAGSDYGVPRRESVIASSRAMDPSVWRVEHPIGVRPSGEPLLLRVSCRLGDSFRPYGAERVALALAPTLEEWLTAKQGHLPVILEAQAASGAVPLRSHRLRGHRSLAG